MAFAYPTSGPALAAPTVHGYGLSPTPGVIAAVPGAYGQNFGGYGAGVASAAPFGQDFSSAFGGAAAYGAGTFAGASPYGASTFAGASPYGAAPFAGSSFAGASPFGAAPFSGASFGGAAPFVGGVSPFVGGAAPIVADSGFNGLYSGYQGQGLDAGFGGAPFVAPSAYGGQFGGYGGEFGGYGGEFGGYNTVSGAVAAPVAPARKVWQNGLRRSLVTGHPTRF